MTRTRRSSARDTISDLESTIALMQKQVEELKAIAAPKEIAPGTQEMAPVTRDAPSTDEFSIDDRIIASLRVRPERDSGSLSLASLRVCLAET